METRSISGSSKNHNDGLALFRQLIEELINLIFGTDVNTLVGSSK